MSGHVLVVDDEPVVLKVLSRVLSDEGFEVSQAPDGATALQLLARSPHDLVLADTRMPGMDGFQLLKEIRRTHPGTDVIMMTGYASLDGAVEAMCLGAADYLIKPLKPKEIFARIRAVLERRRLEAELHLLQSELRSRYDMHNVVAASPRMTAVLSALRRVAQTDDPVVLYGEQGTGRSFLSRAIHYSGNRRQESFVSIACDQIAKDQIGESIFGLEAAAKKPRSGHLERLANGTLHLREPEALEPDLQRRLAECLRSGEVQLLGSGRRFVNRTRIVLSLSGPVDQLLESGQLVPELAVLKDYVSIHVPPMRERNDDMPGLISSFTRSYASERGQNLHVDPDAVDLLSRSNLPGNIAQMYWILNHCAGLSNKGQVTQNMVSLALSRIDNTNGAWAPMAEHLDEAERELVLRAVTLHPGQLDRAAKELGISRTTLWRRMRKYGIRQTTG